MRKRKRRNKGNWIPTRYWRILDTKGEIWAETSRATEVQRIMRPGDRVERLEKRESFRWVEAEPCTCKDGVIGLGACNVHGTGYGP